MRKVGREKVVEATTGDRTTGLARTTGSSEEGAVVPRPHTQIT